MNIKYKDNSCWLFEVLQEISNKGILKFFFFLSLTFPIYLKEENSFETFY